MKQEKEVLVENPKALIFHQTPAAAVCEKEIIERVVTFLNSDECCPYDRRNNKRDKMIYLTWLCRGTYADVGQIYKLSIERIRQICRRITRILRHILQREGMVEIH